jgi:uncharacterized protein (TIGR03086 family)
MGMDSLDFAPATSTMRTLVASVTDDQLTNPTPCDKYTVGDLVEHIGGLAMAFTDAARKRVGPGSAQGGSGDASRLEPGWRDQIDASLAELAEAWRDPAAYDGETQAGGVTMPGPIAASVALNEVVVHGWDLATALGRPFEARDEDVQACMAFAEPFSAPGTEEMRGDAFGPVVAVADDASPLERLLGMMGRRMG